VSSSPTDGDAGTASLVEVTMPQMGVSVAEGTILAWHKRPGDWVEADETICEISTDKVDTEIPSPASGRVVRILVDVNETVAVGTPLAELDTAARPGEAHADEHDGDRRQVDGRASAAMAGTGDAPAEAAPAADTPDRSHVVSPVVQRIATEHGVDLARVKGTGVGGRIRKKDLLAYIESRGAEAPEEAAPAEAAGPEPVLHIESPYLSEREAPTSEPPPAQEAPAPSVEDGSDQAVEQAVEPAVARREPMSVMRRQIAERMLASRRTAAHCTTVAEVDMTSVAARRAELKPAFAERGVSLTYLAFVARATVAALQRHPLLNASIEHEELVYHHDVNLGIAVALEGGLIVPVIRRAQHLSLEGLAAAVADLSARARSKRLSPDEVRGGTFTITNPGQFGTVLATPIINQPQVAILDLEAVVKRPVVIEHAGGDSISIRPMVNLCLSFDHRALDGAEAARFLGTVKCRLEEWVDDG
jgi:pyruvate/2-oxoglutarate dehydrogenase complex dihydrolipoamide acyltransferase (E2) component